MWLFSLVMSFTFAGLNEGCRQCCARDCQDIKYIGFTKSGVYRVIPDGTQEGFDVYCDMDTEGGGWLVFQRRTDGSELFNNSWEDYQRGFGDLSGEHWLGNLALYTVLSQGHYELRVEVEGSGWSKNWEFIYLKLGNPADQFRAAVASYSGETDECIASSNGEQFSITDTSNTSYRGGWWNSACSNSSLNAQWMNSSTSYGIRWVTRVGTEYYLKKTEMKVRKVFA